MSKIVWTLKCLISFVVDLVPKENVERWIQSLQREFPVVAFKASTQIKDKTVVGGAFYTSQIKLAPYDALYGEN